MNTNNNSKALKAGVWYTVGNFILKGSSFLTTPIFTRLLSKQEVGDFSNYSSWLSILMIITTVDLYHAINVARFDFKDDLDSFIASNLLQGSIITTVLFSIIYIFRSFFLHLFSLSSVELTFIFIYCLFCPALQMFQLKCRIDYKYKASVVISLISALSSTLISLILVLTIENKYIGRYVGYTIPIILVNIILYIYLLRKAKSLSPAKYWKYALWIAFPMMWHTLAGNVLTTSDRVMIKYIDGSSDVALYTIAYSCASIVQLLWISMNSAWSPWAIERMGENDYESINKALKPYSIFFGVVVFAFLLVSPEVLFLMGGKDYMPSLSVIPPIMISYVFNFAYSFYANMEIYEKKQIYIALATGSAAIINVLLNAILIPVCGYIIAAYTTLIGYMALFLIHYFVCRKLKKDKLIDNRFIFGFLAGELVVMVLMPLIYSNNWLRYSIIGLMISCSCVIVFCFRNEILSLVKTRSTQAIRNKVSLLYSRLKHEKNRY